MIIKKLRLLSLFCSVSCLAMDNSVATQKLAPGQFIRVGPKNKGVLYKDSKIILNKLFKAGKGALLRGDVKQLKDIMGSFFQKLDFVWQGSGIGIEQLMLYAEKVRQQCPGVKLWIDYWERLKGIGISDEMINSLLLQYVFDNAEHFKKDEFIGMIKKVIVESDDTLLARRMIAKPFSPLLYVLYWHHSAPWLFDVVKLFVECISDKDIKKNFAYSGSEKTVFHIAVIYYDETIADFLLKNLSNALISIGFESIQVILNQQDCCGLTPLHDACLRGNIAMAKWLLKHGACVNAKARNDIQAIHCVMGSLYLLNNAEIATVFFSAPCNDQAFYKQQIAQRKQIIDLLAQHGADFKACDAFNCTAYDYAIVNGHTELSDYLSRFK